MDTERATSVWTDFVKVMAAFFVTVLLIAYWSHSRLGSQVEWVSPPQAVVPHSTVESAYLDVVNAAAPGFMSADNEAEIIAMGKEWCLAMRDGTDPLDALAAVDRQYGESAADFAATIMAAAHAYFCPEEA